jgi:hypothetical protein
MVLTPSFGRGARVGRQAGNRHAPQRVVHEWAARSARAWVVEAEDVLLDLARYVSLYVALYDRGKVPGVSASGRAKPCGTLRPKIHGHDPLVKCHPAPASRARRSC